MNSVITEKVKELYKKGYSDRKIAKEVGIGKTSVFTWRKDNGYAANNKPINEIFNDKLVVAKEPSHYFINGKKVDELFFDRKSEDILFDIFKHMAPHFEKNSVFKSYSSYSKHSMVCMLENLEFGFYKEDLQRITYMISNNESVESIAKKMEVNPFSILLFMLDLIIRKREVNKKAG